MNRFELSPCLILAAACAWGQTANPEFAFREQRVRTGGDAQGVCALDADRDGDLDLFVYRASTEANQLFLNDGQGGFHEASDRLPSLRDRALDACVGDFDRDGDLDLAVVSRGGGLLRPFWRLLDRRARPEPYLLRNDGSGRFSFVPDALPWRGSPDCGRPTGVASADLDRDGDLDLVLSGPRGALVLRNDGSGRFTREALPGEGAPAVASGDYDGDRGADVLLARTFDAALSFPAAGPLARQLGTGVGAVRDVACADLEGDQRDEVAYAGSSGSVVWLDGGQRRIDLPPARFVSAARGGPAGRGMFLFSVERAPRLSDGHGVLAVWWDGAAVRQRHLPCAWSKPVRGVGGDLDGDGRLDLALVARGGSSLTLLFGGSATYVPGASARVERLDAGHTALAAPLDPDLFARANAAAAKDDWAARVANNGRRAHFVPVGPLDPTRELVLLFPGIGANFSDLLALSGLSARYQLVIGVGDYTDTPGRDAALQLTDALERVLDHRAALAQAQGLSASRDLRVVAHSLGCVVSQVLLGELTRRGELGDGGAGRIGRLLYVPLDGAWRGQDELWAVTAVPGVRGIVRRVTNHTATELSLLNRTPTMDACLDAALPAEVVVDLVDAEDAQPDSRQPLRSWYSHELEAGDLERLWSWLRRSAALPSARSDFDGLDRWAQRGLKRTQGLQHLTRQLMRDRDYPAHERALHDAAIAAPSAQAFAPAYDAILDRIVDRFAGEHTPFMWTNPAFMPWLRTRLAQF
ncbi:MAG: VCBS repeat-containing protein [Planctomycetes bacterium]|nr:VCBS repeat-containing protein [Planctomycetota bacterium]